MLNRLTGNSDGVLYCASVRAAVRDDRDAVDAEQRCAAKLAPVDSGADLSHPGSNQQAAELAGERLRNFLAQRTEQKVGCRLGHLDRDVANKSIGDDDVRLRRIDVLRLDVADESGQNAREPLGGLAHSLVALALLLAIAEQPDARLRTAAHLARADRAPD